MNQEINAFGEAGADLEMVGVQKRFPGFTAIEHLDLTIPAGSFFALLGPSGCGKTTALRMVSGLEDPTEGRILIGGVDVTEMKPHKRPVNTVFQSYALFPHMSILENVAFGLRRRNISDPLGKAHEALQLVELDHVSDRKPAQLSGGQQQRVALARALAVSPRLLLLDEPSLGLAPLVTQEVFDNLRRVTAETGTAVLLVEQNANLALDFAARAYVLEAGTIVMSGPAEQMQGDEAIRSAYLGL